MPRNRTGDVWHVWVKGVVPGQPYTYGVVSSAPSDGEPRASNRKLDPCATAIAHRKTDGAPRCIFTPDIFDWQNDKPPRHAWSKTVIYETHIRGLTANPNSEVESPGTFHGLVEKIPYLKDLGVTAIEVLPVQEFDSRGCIARSADTRLSLHNYWGYGPFAVFAPHGAYSSSGDRGAQTREFKEMVRSLHAADIELIVDISFAPAADIVGPSARQFIIEALRYWVAQMHVDGFRLDLTALLGRDGHGQPRHNPQLLEEIAEDPVLRDTKLIATGWDTAGAYDVGTFSECRWAEWNTRYRDDIRRFWRGDLGAAGAFASRISGSEDLFSKSGKGPEIGINFVTSHDGLTLNDLVTYQRKHNLPNGRGNRDGAADDYSANYGVEGPTAEAGIESIRQRQLRNFLLTLAIRCRDPPGTVFS